MDYHLLETFLTVCETRNLTTASKLLYKTQPTITNRINQLEEELGFDLFIREKGNKSVTITNKGLEFFEIAQRFMEFYGEIEAFQSNSVKSINISSTASYSTPIVSDICKKMVFEEDTGISLYTYQTKEAYKKVANKKIDIAFVSQPCNVSGVKVDPIFSQNYYIIKYCHPNSQERSALKLPKISTDELDPDFEIYQRWDQDFEDWHKRKVSLQKPKIRIDSTALLKQFLLDSNYWSIVQESNIPILEKEMPIEIFRIIDPPPPRKCYMISNLYPDRNMIPVINKFKQILQRYITEHKDFIQPYFK